MCYNDPRNTIGEKENAVKKQSGIIEIVMCKITSSGLNTGVTIIPNSFIDNYLADADGRDLKVFLYLMRYSYVPEADISLSAMAETLDYTANQILKALRNWQKLGLLDFALNDKKEIEHIWLADINTAVLRGSQTAVTTEAASVHASSDAMKQETPSSKASPLASKPKADINDTLATSSDISGSTTADDFSSKMIYTAPTANPVSLPDYGIKQISEICDDADFKRLMDIVEKYLAPKQLDPQHIKVLLGIYEYLGFSDDLIIYLYDYCCSNDKKSPKYIEKVAISWFEKGIKTAGQAQEETQFYNKLMGGIRKALGLSNEKGLNTTQIKSVTKWVSEYQLPDDVIITACERAATAEVAKPFAYASKIIDDWHKDGIKTIDDVAKRDKAYVTESKTSNPVAARRKSTSSYNQFNDYNQRVYSKEEELELERKLILRNSHTQEERDALAERLRNS